MGRKERIRSTTTATPTRRRSEAVLDSPPDAVRAYIDVDEVLFVTRTFTPPRPEQSRVRVRRDPTAPTRVARDDATRSFEILILLLAGLCSSFGSRLARSTDFNPGDGLAPHLRTISYFPTSSTHSLTHSTLYRLLDNDMANRRRQAQAPANAPSPPRRLPVEIDRFWGEEGEEHDKWLYQFDLMPNSKAGTTHGNFSTRKYTTEVELKKFIQTPFGPRNPVTHWTQNLIGLRQGKNATGEGRARFVHVEVSTNADASTSRPATRPPCNELVHIEQLIRLSSYIDVLHESR